MKHPTRSGPSSARARLAGASALAAAVVALAGAGCKPEPGGVRKACESRRAWQHESSRKCTNCIAKASTPKCNVSCTDKEYSGKCADAHDAMRKEPTCEGVVACVKACAIQDCDCIDRCYEGKPVCEGLAGVADACTGEVCDAYCR